MRLRPAFLGMGNAGAVQNARRSLEERGRAQDEVAALIARLDAELRAQGGAAAAPVPDRAGEAGAA